MKTVVLTGLNLGLIVMFVIVLRRQGLLTYSHQGRAWLTYLAVAIITLMDELTSIFTPPRRPIGSSA